MQANYPVLLSDFPQSTRPEGSPIEIHLNEDNPIPRAATRSLSKIDLPVQREISMSHFEQSENFRR